MNGIMNNLNKKKASITPVKSSSRNVDISSRESLPSSRIDDGDKSTNSKLTNLSSPKKKISVKKTVPSYMTPMKKSAATPIKNKDQPTPLKSASSFKTKALPGMAGTVNSALMEKFKKEKMKMMSETPTRKAQSRNVVDLNDISVASPLATYGAKRTVNTEVSEYSAITKTINLGNVEDLEREENIFKSPNSQYVEKERNDDKIKELKESHE